MSVTVSPFEVVKTGDPRSMRIEVEKMARAKVVAESTGLFNVPSITSYDESSGVLVMERVQGLRGVRTISLRDRRYPGLMENIGLALAAIHNDLWLSDEFRVELPERFRSESEVFLHGDFSGENVCVLQITRVPVVLDWQTSRLCGGVATVGTRYFDLVFFLANLFKRSPLRMRSDGAMLSVVRRFLSAYRSQMNGVFDQRQFGAYHANFYALRTKERKRELTPVKRLALAPSHMAWGRLIRALEAEGI